MSARDRWLYPIVLDDTNNTIVVKKDAVTTTQAVPPGVYYNYDGSIPGFPSILTAVKSALSASGLTSVFEGSIPFESYAFGGGGVRFYATWPFSWVTSNAAFSDTLRRALGLSEEDSEAMSDHFHPFTTFGAWLEPRDGVSYKQATYTKTQFRGPGISERTRLNQRWGSHKFRRFNYKFAPAGVVYPGGVDHADYQAVARLAVGDANNLWWDVWQAGLSTGAPCLVMHDTDGEDIGVGDYEIVRAAGDYMDEFERTLTERAELSRTYDIDLICQVIGGPHESF